MNPAFSLLIKPASCDCNLHCNYCFYLQKEKIFGKHTHRMSEDTLECLTRQYLRLPLATYTFDWQGGEPTLMGLPFFKRAIQLQKQVAPPNATIQNAIQTNGTLINDDWATFLHDNHFLTGISIDGPAKLHNMFRKTADGRNSHEAVIKGLKALQRHDADVNALTLISAANQGAPVTVYNYLRELGVNYHQYIECVETDTHGKPLPYALKPGQWGDFLCAIFDEWFKNDIGKVSVRLFDSIVSRLVTGAPTICPMNGNCCNYLVVEHDGSVYPCDFNVTPELKLGSIHTATFHELTTKQDYLAWGTQKQPKNNDCHGCKWLPLCMGDCPKNRRHATSFLCNDWKQFYQHTIQRFELLASSITAR